MVQTLGHSTQLNNHSKFKSPKLLSRRIRKRYCKTLGTNVIINSPLSTPSLGAMRRPWMMERKHFYFAWQLVAWWKNRLVLKAIMKGSAAARQPPISLREINLLHFYTWPWYSKSSFQKNQNIQTCLQLRLRLCCRALKTYNDRIKKSIKIHWFGKRYRYPICKNNPPVHTIG